MDISTIEKNEFVLPGKHVRPITLDFTYQTIKNQKIKKPVIVFCHGFKGFKDWGTFNLVAKKFAQYNYNFVKFNFSHNGTTPADFSDLHDKEAFGNNNFEIELDDLGSVLDWLQDGKNPLSAQINTDEIYVIGHSRGGGIALLKTIEDSRIKKVTCWATVNDLEKFMHLNNFEEWSKTGVSWVKNTRTGIDFPLYFQFSENFYKSKDRLNLKKNLMKLDKPLLLLHGNQDKSVSFTDSEWIYKHVMHAIFIQVENGDHTFGGRHPWLKETLPEDLNFAIEETIEFFNF